MGAAALALALLPGAVPVTSLDVDIVNLRSQRGVIRICLTADPQNFPGCVDDKRAVTRSIPATSPSVRIDGLARGEYALSVIHDENGNSKLDTFAGIPREGFGFSRNPRIAFGPPRFAAAEFAVEGQGNRQEVRIRYLL